MLAALTAPWWAAHATASSPKGQTGRPAFQPPNKPYTVDCLSALMAVIVAQFAPAQDARQVPGG